MSYQNVEPVIDISATETRRHLVSQTQAAAQSNWYKHVRVACELVVCRNMPEKPAESVRDVDAPELKGVSAELSQSWIS